MWNQYLEGKKNQFYNPIMQNQGHIKNLCKYLEPKETDNIFSFIAFSGRAEVKVEFEAKRLFVGITDDCIFETKHLIKKLEPCFTEDELLSIYHRLLPYTDNSDAIKDAHIEHVKRMQKTYK